VTDVLVVGAGPAGAVASTLLARAGVRVSMVDRATFPRPKLCGDTLNPGTIAILRRLGLSDGVEQAGLALFGMRVSSGSGVVVEGRYRNGLFGRSLSRSELDWLLVQQAVAAGVRFEAGVTVRGPLLSRSPAAVTGVAIEAHGAVRELKAAVVLAADGRRSTLAFGCGLLTHPAAPRRWAIGAHIASATATTPLGEMHLRAGHYIGMAPLPRGVWNACLVQFSPTPGSMRDPAQALLAALRSDPILRDRFGDAALIGRPAVLGPLAVDRVAGRDVPEGLLIAGDAAGFVDPMTGDGMRFAVRDGELAASAALRALEHGWHGVHAAHAAERRREFAAKWRFNRTLRSLVESSALLGVAAAGARFVPGVVRALINHAGDCGVAGPSPDGHRVEAQA
jgi:flavin-dependent dehydrogenase